MVKIPLIIQQTLSKLKKEGYQAYVVGGAVRDLLLGKKINEIKDWDIATNAKPDKIQQIFPNSFYRNKYGTVTIPIDKNKLFIEITPFRKEIGYSDKRHPDKIEWANSLEQDLQRRDFTINSLAYDGEKIIDIFGGKNDLKNKIIRTVGKPERRFKEDALRLMRAIRFASQLGFHIENNTLEAIKKNSYLIKNISRERIRDEFFKILTSKYNTEGILFLKNTGLLRNILPELDNCFGVQQKSPQRHHIYDVGTHLVLSLKYCPSKNYITRFACLIHDIGKPVTYKKDPKTNIITFYNHEVIGAKLAEKIANRFRLSNKEKDKLIKLVKYHQFTTDEHQTDKAIRRFIRNVTPQYIEDMFALREGDRTGSGVKPSSWRFELFKKRVKKALTKPFTVKDLKVNGDDVMNILKIKPGPAVGKVLNKLFKRVTEGKTKNERETLINEIKKIKRKKIIF